MEPIGDPKYINRSGKIVKATDLDTDLWHQVIDKLIQHGWTCIDEYDGIDAGIDYNSYKLQKERDMIKFEWFVYTEGEFTCTLEILREVERITGQSFKWE